MCGISGLACLTTGCRPEDHAHIVSRICDLQHHRGPDDRGGVAIDNVYLGSNRLKILDLSAAGHMPMTHAGWWIVFNGEIYNFKELRGELESHGHTFQTHTDTEIVLHAFQEWGEACIHKFLGMFAFAIFDPKTRTTTLVRDRYGKKPLYYTQRSGHFIFASELQALMQVSSDLRPNQQRLIEWSLYRNVDFGSKDTLVQGLNQLMPGHLLTINGTTVGEQRAYYSPESHVARDQYLEFSGMPERAVVDRFDELIKAGVESRLVSDVPVGTLCSGGIDSSLVTALCTHSLGKSVAAFNVAIQGYHELDENRFAQTVADSLGIQLLTYSLTGADFRRTLTRAMYHSDEPLTHANSIAYLLVCEFARQQGVTVLLSGEAADELFGGYRHRHRRIGHIAKAQRVLKHAPPWLRRAMSLLGYVADGVPLAAFGGYPGLLGHSTSFIDRYARETLRLRCEEAYAFVENETERAILSGMLADVTDFLAPLLSRLDRMSMAASIETRCPFLDHRIVHAAVNLPMKFKLRGNTDKWILKEVARRYVPAEIVDRKKKGFPLPVADYLAPLANRKFFEHGFCTEVLEMQAPGLLHTVDNWRSNVHGFFNLLALEIWGRLFFLNESIDQVNARLESLQTTR
ncbi:MAG: asparagine synthase (glutamine-hydrolyzing) [Gammaproteobacteria bacterium]